MHSSVDDTLNPSSALRIFVLLAIICGFLIVGGRALGITAATGPSTLTLGDISEAHIVEIRDSRGNPVLFGEFRSRVDMLGNTEKDAALYDRRGQMVVGEVELEIPAPDRQDRRPELEVDVISLPPSATFTVVIDDRAVGTFRTDDRGSIDIELEEGEIPPLFRVM